MVALDDRVESLEIPGLTPPGPWKNPGFTSDISGTARIVIARLKNGSFELYTLVSGVVFDPWTGIGFIGCPPYLPMMLGLYMYEIGHD